MASFATGNEVEAAVIGALRPRSVGQRIVVFVTGGWTRAQVLGRLSARVKAALEREGTADAGLRVVLQSLVAQGTVRTKKVRGTLVVNTQGPRDLLWDVYRLD